jgi:integrase
MPKLSIAKADIVYKNAQPKDKDHTISDGQGLYLLIPSSGIKQWIFRYTFQRKAKKIAIKGGYPAISVKNARDQAEEFRSMLRNGIDPADIRKQDSLIDAKKSEEDKHEAARLANTLKKLTLDWHKTRTNWTPKYKSDILARMGSDIFPFLGETPITDINSPMLLAELRKIEKRGAIETAHRVVGILGQIFDFAIAQGLVAVNPARPLRKALIRTQENHFAAILDPNKVGALLLAIEGYQGTVETRTALLLGIYTFVRPGNLRQAEWKHFQFEQAEWRIPGSDMKCKTTHDFTVPLAPQVIQLLRELHPLTGRGKFLFPKANSTTIPMSNNTVNAAYRRMGYTNCEMTGHGVRAMARTLCHEVLGYDPEAIEAQLAHAKSGPLGSAYDRTTHIEKRKEMMNKYADYLDTLREKARSPDTRPLPTLP